MVFTAEEIKARVEPIMKKNMVKRAILFGSYVKGTATEKSDVDLIIDSELNGLAFFGLVEDIHECLSDKLVDVIDSREIIPGSLIDKEVRHTGVEIYASQR